MIFHGKKKNFGNFKDDFGPKKIDRKQCNMILDLIDEPYRCSSTIISSQLIVNTWFNCFAEPTIAGAIIDKVTNSHSV
ncbi:ATP-binding protein [Galbibacter sp.]|uniref:ATP-binding protein n=1 Tax=Galbibacter sp. TaxID=2918471 RepID=UPI003A8F1A8A